MCTLSRECELLECHTICLKAGTCYASVPRSILISNVSWTIFQWKLFNSSSFFLHFISPDVPSELRSVSVHCSVLPSARKVSPGCAHEAFNLLGVQKCCVQYAVCSLCCIECCCVCLNEPSCSASRCSAMVQRAALKRKRFCLSLMGARLILRQNKATEIGAYLVVTRWIGNSWRLFLFNGSFFSSNHAERLQPDTVAPERVL